MFSLVLRIGGEFVGAVNAAVDADSLVFQHKTKALRLTSTCILRFTRDGDALTITTSLSQKAPVAFECDKIVTADRLFLLLQTTFPTIPFEYRPTTALMRRLAKQARATTDASSFYGPRQAPLSAQLGPAFAKELVYRIEHSAQCQIDGIARPHMSFALQQPAIDFLHACRSKHPTTTARLFSFETAGSRKFLVADADLFADTYLQTAPHQRHVYEIIREDHPCRLYFDLEFTKAYNPQITMPSALLDMLFDLVALAFYRDYGLCLRRSDVVDLASSSDSKFSHHWIVAPRTADGRLVLFQNNIHAGHFVKRLLATFVDDTHPLNVFKKDGSRQLLVDTGVYTRCVALDAASFMRRSNRAFRLWLSSKYGSDRRLQRAPMCQAPFTTDAAFLEAAYVVPTAGAAPVLLQSSPSEHIGRGSTRIKGPPAAYQYGPSPYPALDAFIREQATTGGVQGEIRSWQCTEPWITYHMDRNRFCGRVGRAHKSNNVMFVVDRLGGVYYQRCHDPDCAGYRCVGYGSPAMALPPALRHRVKGLAEGEDA
ncbi:hypothetical protein ACHHYP_06130 [Achlya hypogyna]|uniref:DNA-directed primase/polymerase protein n=1 Tax=Achlya hypogyna TaxID=1202772 RepID=A0A1V9YV16_ACHHY|nr:hypothetical protein ACHHYP_06130 [Achlya hypogyna]